MKSIIPSLWFSDNNCEEAIHYYISVFPDSELVELVRYPREELDIHFQGMTDKVLSARFNLNHQPFLGTDGGPYFQFSEAISFTIECRDQAEIDYYWSKLSHVPEAEQCGWCKDRFGVSWQIVPDNMAKLLVTDEQIRAMMAMKKILVDELRAAGAGNQDEPGTVGAGK